ncbi:glycosyl hydrolase 53 family protein [Kibdelosporangium aridum]|uniref:glycosyl hydrolase 53 family protein n=1 Tax=Kibdelosporangium aridum TaxID=2030 RepID=UPI0035EA3958
MPQMEARGFCWNNSDGQRQDQFTILKRYGITAISLRTWVNPVQPPTTPGTPSAYRGHRRVQTGLPDHPGSWCTSPSRSRWTDCGCGVRDGPAERRTNRRHRDHVHPPAPQCPSSSD